MSPDLHYYDDDNDEACPDYDTVIHRSNTVTTSSSGLTFSSGSSGASGSSNVHWKSPVDAPRSVPHLRSYSSPGPSQLRRATSPLPLATVRPPLPRYLYTYNMTLAGAPLTFLISVEPSDGKPTPEAQYTLRLSLKVDDVERPVCEPVSLRLTLDPRKLEFVVFAFPAKNNVLPTGCLHSLRVWLRANGVDHRIFGEDELWLGADLDFGEVENASFAAPRMVNTTAPLPDVQVYDAVVGRARVQFVIRWHPLGARNYRYSMEYVAGGVGSVLMDDLRLHVDGDPRRVAFLVYSVPIRSVPMGASHRLRLWLKTPAISVPPAIPPDAPRQTVDSYVYQRVWKSDTFKIGARLDFEALGPRLVMGSSAGPPQTVVVEAPSRSSPVGYQRDVKAIV